MYNLKQIDIDGYNKVLERLQINSDNYYNEMREITLSIYDYIKNKIKTPEREIPFTMLDYYSIYNKNIDEITEFIRKHQEEFKEKRGALIRFFTASKHLGSNVTAQDFANKKISFICKDNKIEFDEENSSILLELLGDNIPKNYKIVYTAAQRYARGESIFPLRNITEENIQRKKLKK